MSEAVDRWYPINHWFGDDGQVTVEMKNIRTGEKRTVLTTREKLRTRKIRMPEPIDMVIFCPVCREQHIDAPSEGWENPPHTSHLCHYCKHIFRLCDVPTNGVEDIETVGKHDTWIWKNNDQTYQNTPNRKTHNFDLPRTATGVMMVHEAEMNNKFLPMFQQAKFRSDILKKQLEIIRDGESTEYHHQQFWDWAMNLEPKELENAVLFTTPLRTRHYPEDMLSEILACPVVREDLRLWVSEDTESSEGVVIEHIPVGQLLPKSLVSTLRFSPYDAIENHLLTRYYAYGGLEDVCRRLRSLGQLHRFGLVLSAEQKEQLRQVRYL